MREVLSVSTREQFDHVRFIATKTGSWASCDRAQVDKVAESTHHNFCCCPRMFAHEGSRTSRTLTCQGGSSSIPGDMRTIRLQVHGCISCCLSCLQR